MTQSVRNKRLNRKAARQMKHTPANRMVKQAHRPDVPKDLRRGPNSKLRAAADHVPARAVLDRMKVAELRELCLSRGIPINSKLRKKDLIEMLGGGR
jgi:hypothetical protein